MKEIGDQIQELALHMNQIMKENTVRGKFGWDTISLADAIQRLVEESGEVAGAAIFVAMNYDHLSGWKQLQKEVVDVANFCMMIHNLCANQIQRLEKD